MTFGLELSRIQTVYNSRRLMMKTEINPEMRSMLPRGVNIKDMALKTTKNAILKAAYARTQMLHSITSSLLASSRIYYS